MIGHSAIIAGAPGFQIRQFRPVPGIERLVKKIEHAGSVGARRHGTGKHKPDLERAGRRIVAVGWVPGLVTRVVGVWHRFLTSRATEGDATTGEDTPIL